eukprot:TRINITY_DN7166_c0_g1_i1.p1 TRINITY_DN7166_c0_g1~~TRINITY_DN7166_c0_g1_i1.p1  ORF type:complete len:412 (-),score=96.96 TRINITY_DN7166_c0_g1_i1:233-1468(-)
MFNVEHHSPVSAEDVAVVLFTRVKETVEAYVGDKVKNVVLAVPVNFEEQQRAAIINAASQAGLHVVRLINEPTASILAYKLDSAHSTFPTQKLYLVFDLGASNLNMSLVSVFDGVVKIVASSTNDGVGGDAINKRMANYFSLEFQRKFKSEINGRRSIYKLLSASETAKKILSQNNQSSVEVDSLYDGIDFFSSITRAKFEDLSGDLFRSYAVSIDELLSKAKVERSQVDGVVLAGGSSRIPAIQQMIANYFPGKEVHKSISPEEVVAYGAAIESQILATPSPVAKPPKVDKHGSYNVEVIAQPIGFDLAGKMCVVFPKSAQFPSKHKFRVSTSKDDQKEIVLKIYSGESVLVKENTPLGSLIIKDLTSITSGEAKIEITFELDPHGNLTVSASESNLILSSLSVPRKKDQ